MTTKKKVLKINIICRFTKILFIKVKKTEKFLI